MAPHSNTLAWRIPWMGEPGGLQSVGLKDKRVATEAPWPPEPKIFTIWLPQTKLANT